MLDVSCQPQLTGANSLHFHTHPLAAARPMTQHGRVTAGGWWSCVCATQQGASGYRSNWEVVFGRYWKLSEQCGKSGTKLKACLHCIHKINICSEQIPKFCSVVSERLLCVFLERYIFEVIFFTFNWQHCDAAESEGGLNFSNTKWLCYD